MRPQFNLRGWPNAPKPEKAIRKRGKKKKKKKKKKKRPQHWLMPDATSSPLSLLPPRLILSDEEEWVVVCGFFFWRGEGAFGWARKEREKGLEGRFLLLVWRGGGGDWIALYVCEYVCVCAGQIVRTDLYRISPFFGGTLR